MHFKVINITNITYLFDFFKYFIVLKIYHINISYIFHNINIGRYIIVNIYRTLHLYNIHYTYITCLKFDVVTLVLKFEILPVKNIKIN